MRNLKKTIWRLRMAMTPALPAPHQSTRLNALPSTDSKLMDAAKKLEATFLAEMLKSAGFGASRESFGGGVGEDQFSSFLIREQADEMVNAGGIGLAQALFEAMKVRMDA
jgi:Rod binding domain-containing protein